MQVLTSVKSEAPGRSVVGSLRPRYSQLVRASGASFEVSDGRTLVDLSAQTLNLALGQGNERVTTAVIDQIRNAQFASSRFGTEHFLRLSDRLAALAPDGLDAVVLKLTDGSDAVETAMKLAFLQTRRTRVACLEGAWHGETIATLALSSSHSGRLIAGAYDAASIALARDFEALARLVSEAPAPFAAAIVDPASVSSGLVREAEAREGLRALRAACDSRGTILIFDEIQTFGGFLGEDLFAAEHYGVTPDIICIGKALGAGYPLAAVICRSDMKYLLQYNDAEFTYGGQPVACAAALAALDVYETLRPALLNRERNFAKLLVEVFDSRAMRVTQVGLMASVQPRFERHSWGTLVATRAFERGVYVRAGNHGASLILKPPITLDLDEMRSALEVVAAECARLENWSLVTSPLQGTATDEHAAWRRLAELCAIDPATRPRTGLERYEISAVLRRSGVDCEPVLALQSGDIVRDLTDSDGVEPSTLAGVLSGSVDPARINALVLRQHELVVLAHDTGVFLGGRTPATTNVGDDGTVVLSNLAWTSDAVTVGHLALEEVWLAAATIALVTLPELRRSLERRLKDEMVRRYPALPIDRWWSIAEEMG